MSQRRIRVNLPHDSIQRNDHVEFTILVDPGRAGQRSLALGAVTIRAYLPEHLYSDVEVEPYPFGGAEDTGVVWNGPVGHGGTYTFTAARLDGTVGEVRLVKISAKITAPSGSKLPLVVEAAEALSTGGHLLIFDRITRYISVGPASLRIAETDLPEARVDTQYQAVLRAGGGLPPYSWSLISGELPSGLSLDEAGFISGSPHTQGSSGFRLQVTDSEGGSAATDCIINVQDIPLAITLESLPAIAPNFDYLCELTSIGGVGSVTWFAENLPEGLSVEGNRISGRLERVPESFNPVEVRVEARDSGDPGQVARRSLRLRFLALLPGNKIDIESPGVVAIGKDLLRTDYRIKVKLATTSGKPDREFESGIREMQEAILAEVFGREDLAGPAGPGGLHDFLIPEDIELLNTYRELDSMCEGGMSVRYSVEVGIDGDTVLNSSTGSALLISRKSKGGPGGGNGPGTLDRKRNRLFDFLGALSGRIVFPAIRKKFNRILIESSVKVKEETDPLSKTGGSNGKATGGKDKYIQELFINAVSNRFSCKVLRAVSAASACVLFGSLLFWGPTGLITAALSLFASYCAGTATLMSACNKRLNWFHELVKAGRIQLLDVSRSVRKEDEVVTVRMTPGSHIVNVKWEISDVLGSVMMPSPGRDMPDRVSYRIEIKPVNPEDWPRFGGETVVTGAGIGSGSADHQESIFGSDTDIIVSTANSGFHLIASKGDGIFSSSIPIFPNYNTSGVTHIRTGRLDEIGRNSIVAVDTSQAGSGLTLFMNAGIHDYSMVNIAYNDISGDEGIIKSCDIGHLDGDRWMEIVCGLEDKFAVISGLGGFCTGDSDHPVINLVSTDSTIEKDPIVDLIISQKLAEEPSGDVELDINHIALIKQLAGEVAIYENDGTAAFRLLTTLEGVSGDFRQRMPEQLIRCSFSTDAVYLGVVFGQLRSIALWKKSGADWLFSEPLPVSFRPQKIEASVSAMPGFVIKEMASRSLHLLELFYWPVENEDPRLLPLLNSAGDIDIDSRYGLVCAALSAENQLYIYD